MLHQARALAGPVSGLGALNGALLQAARSDQPVNIARGSAWSFMWTGWQRPTRQHDAAEFLQHLCQRTDCTALRGGWEARTQQERAYEIVDEQFTCLHSRLPLQRPFQIQEAIQQWHNHEAVHALTSAPDLLILSFHIQRRIEVPTFVGHAGAIEHTIHAVWWCPAHRQSGQWSLQATTNLWPLHLVHDDNKKPPKEQKPHVKPSSRTATGKATEHCACFGPVVSGLPSRIHSKCRPSRTV